MSIFRRSSYHRSRIAVLGFASAWLAAPACAEPTPPECPSAVATAESTYLECAEALGLEVEQLEITEAGDISVSFGEDGYTDAKADLAQRECEPPMEEALALGLLACETTQIGHQATPQELEAQVQQAGEDGFSGSVAIVRDGTLVWSGGVGLADRTLGIANTPGTAFDFGSIMKVVTAVAILQLEQDGLLSRDATLSELLSDVPTDKRTITIDQVLTHRAGFQEFHDTTGDFEPIDRDTALARILAQELRFEPGTDEGYSNTGYTLLAIVVELESGMGFSEYIRTRVFDAAGMASTGVYGDALWSEGQAAIGYDDGTFGCNSPGCWPAPSWALIGNGGLVSTVEDMLRFTAAVDDGLLLSPNMRDVLRREVVGARELWIDGERAYGYSGRNDFGFGAAVGEVPARDTWVVVASNAASNLNDNVLLAQLLQMSLGQLLEIGTRSE